MNVRRAALVTAFAGTLAACQSPPPAPAAAPALRVPAYRFQFFAMGSPWALELRTADASLDFATVEKDFQRQLRLYDETFSDWMDDSELRRLEAQGLSDPAYRQATPLFFAGLALAQEAFTLSGGAFDLTVGAVVWKERARPVGMVSLDLRRDSQKFRFAVDPVRLTFGGIAKGMVVGEISERLRRAGVRDFRVDGGNGNGAVAGSFAEGLPPELRGRDRGTCPSPVYFVANSAARQNGRPHIIDPRAPSAPVRGSVRLVCRSCAETQFRRIGALSDALTKALLVEKFDPPEELDCRYRFNPEENP